MTIQSTSRKRLFVFNPDCELAIANGSRHYMPSANIVKMAEDLAFLPAYLGKEGDCVLLKKLPDETFIKNIEPLKIKCKGILEREIITSGVEIGEAWGQSPSMNHWFARQKLGEEWKPEQKEWSSRLIARKALGRLMEKMPFGEADIIPSVCHSISEIEYDVGGGRFLVKAPWSSSGRGILALENKIRSKEREWLQGMLKRQGYLMLEKRLEKVQDLAMEFYADDKAIDFIAWSSFTTGYNGEYRGNYVGLQKDIEQKVIQWVGVEIVDLLKHELPIVLRELLPCYRGYLGIDMMIYRNSMGRLCIQPCVEINLRCNMGIVAFFLSERYLLHGTVGKFTIDYYAHKGEALEQHRKKLQQNHLVYKNNRILSGYLNLTPIDTTTQFVAALICD